MFTIFYHFFKLGYTEIVYIIIITTIQILIKK